jgi:uncharacterized protein (DUF58 family)
MITRQGSLAAGTSLLFVVAARLLGSLELFLLGIIGFAVVLFAAGFVALRAIRIEVVREVTPPRVHAGSPSRVDLVVANRGGRATPVLRLRDPVSGTRGANLLVGPLDPATEARASYRLPTERRGVVEIGPMHLSVSDPFGLARRTLRGAGASHLTVYPPVHTLAALPPTGGADPQSGLDRHRTLNRGGDNFYALRRFTVGDELRRVHWPSTARHDELMVRQEELPWQGRITVVVDNTRGRVHPDALDVAATIAASIAHTAHRKGNLVRLVTGDGTDSGFTSGNAQFESILEVLAEIQPRSDASLRLALDTAATQVRHGGVVTVTPELEGDGYAAVQKLSRSFASVTAVLVDPSAWDPDAPPGQHAATRQLVRVTRDDPFPGVWNRAMAAPLGATAGVGR